jgi:hypothetical protein
MQKVVRDGKVAVLVSSGYGAGWSTWELEDADLRNKLMYDPAMVQMLEENLPVEDLADYATVAYRDHYLGGLDNLYIVWVPQGDRFRIRENDGAEWVELCNNIEWEVA